MCFPCLLFVYTTPKTIKMLSKFIIFEIMWSDARIPAFGQLRPPPQRRVLRTMYLMVCEHESIVRQHSEIVFLDVICRTETSSWRQFSWFLEFHQMMIWRSLSTWFLMLSSIMNITDVYFHRFLMTHENHHFSTMAGKAEIHQYLCEIGRLNGNQHANPM